MRSKYPNLVHNDPMMNAGQGGTNARGSCSVCRHAQLNAITGDLVARVPLRTIESRYGVSRSALDRHVQHIPKAVRLVADAANIAGPVLAQVRSLQSRTLRILRQAEQSKDLAIALHAIREGRRNCELIGKLTGELDPRASGEGSGGPLHVTINYVQRPLPNGNVNGQAAPEAAPKLIEGARAATTEIVEAALNRRLAKKLGCEPEEVELMLPGDEGPVQ